MNHYDTFWIYGSTPKALIDCGTWQEDTNHENQLSGYMCFSRAETIEGICVVQPYPPNLFCQGDLPGPNLLLQFWRGDIEQKSLQEAWNKHSKKPRKPNNWNWLQEMPLLCRGCTEVAGRDILKPAKEFPNHGDTHLWDRVIALGMERFCRECSKSRSKNSGLQGKEHGVKGKEYGVQGKEMSLIRSRIL